MVVVVEPKMVERGVLFLIAAAAIIGVIAVIAGHWVVAAAMVLVVLGQGIVFRKARAARRATAVEKST
jgi:hypothetical protein